MMRLDVFSSCYIANSKCLVLSFTLSVFGNRNVLGIMSSIYLAMALVHCACDPVPTECSCGLTLRGTTPAQVNSKLESNRTSGMAVHIPDSKVTPG